MYLNKLYNFIHTEIFEHDKQRFDKATLFRQTHLNGTPYYLLQLPKKKNKFPEGLTLIEHHISIYEQPLNIIDKLSEYHYTATFKDKQRKTYRLHVYFDQLDAMISSPRLVLETSNQEYESTAGNEFDVDWLAVSKRTIGSIIAKLRDEQNNHCALLKNKIAALDKVTVQLSMNLEKNKKKYLTTLDQQIKLSTQLNAINSREDMQKKIGLLETIYQKVDVEISSPRSSRKTKEIASSATQSTTPEASQLTKADAANVRKTAISKKNKYFPINNTAQEESLTPKINKLSDKLLQIGSTTDESEKTAMIQDLFQRISELQLIVSSSKVNSIQTLKKMEQSVISMGKKHLHSLLFKNKFNQAVQLSALFSVALDDTILKKALIELNANLLDFILKNKKYDLEKFKLKIHDKNYDSILDYLLQCDFSSSKAEQCFNILLTHKMSLLRNDSVGLPLLLPIIEDEKHPLANILLSNLEGSPENLHLLKQMINFFETQKKNFLPDTTHYQRISKSLALMKKLDEDLSTKLKKNAGSSSRNSNIYGRLGLFALHDLIKFSPPASSTPSESSEESSESLPGKLLI
ncbi:hypothetical protein OQJ05_01280 [Fluoribacter gormanii]|uniref:hypothetical protein n=1 Tax=Fluoribacter gormanii TaxID=464 RepID=UPI0022438AD2|nr:hypothetical protein [Fluoribacter gormanii]MCW8442684.1 hypothetical protein [Fluoribacter gormanii]